MSSIILEKHEARWLVWSLLVLCLMFNQASSQVNPDNRKKDIVYARQSQQDVGYSATTGEITQMTCGQIIINTADGKHLLYTRDIVQRVVLDPSYPDRNKGWERAVTRCWNRETPILVNVVQNAIPDWSPIKLTAKVPAGLDTFLAVVILMSVLLYAAYKLYEFSIDATRVNCLNRAKLDMEVRKLRYEIEGLKKQMGVATDVIAEKTGFDESAPFDFRIPRIHITDFLKHKVLRMPTEEGTLRIAERWRNKWRNYGPKERRLVANYHVRLVMNYLGTYCVAMMCLGTLGDVFIFPFLPDSALTGWATFGGSFLFLVWFVFLLAVLLRLNTNRRIMRETYLRARGLPV